MKTKSTRRGFNGLTNRDRYYENGALIYSNGPGLEKISWEDFVTTGNNIPNWRQLIATGQDATTYLEGYRRYINYTPGYSYRSRKEVFGQQRLEESETVGPLVNSFLYWPSDPAVLSEVEANNKALTRFNARTLEVNQTFNGGVFLGELGQTIRGIKRPAESLFRSIGSYRREARELRSTIARSREHLNSLRSRERRAVISNANRAIAGLYLEKQFHWDPLLSDIEDGVKTLAEMSASPQSYRIVSGSYKDKSATTTSEVTQDAQNHWIAYETNASEVSVRYKGAVGIQPKDSRIPSMTNLGLGLRNFVPTMWELVPYSFVADYFSNIGDVINGWSSGGYNVRWCMKTVRKDCSVQRTFNKGAMNNTTFWNILRYDLQAPRLVRGITRVIRARYDGPYTPSLSWELPGTSTKWLNLGALFSARSLDRFL